MSDDPVPVARRLELAGIVLVIAGALMLAGGLSTRWVEGKYHVGYTYEEGDISQDVELGPAGVRSCNGRGCATGGWRSLHDARTPRSLAIAVLIGDVLGGLWALVAGMLAVGGSVRVLRPVWLRWPLAVLAMLGPVLATFLCLDAGDTYLYGDLAFGLIGPLLAWFAIARLARPVFRALDLSGDPTGATLR